MEVAFDTSFFFFFLSVVILICCPLWPVLVLAGMTVLKSKAQPTESQQCPTDIEF